ncbi:CIA30 family protein [Rubripirellula tenax]|uniref:CIA30 family protein n=1 Tax=Rubripirellula tenax TaxID=2528015 RepID=UPI001FE5C445|nr:CIA30 family protein [Rubripirellula tenax]
MTSLFAYTHASDTGNWQIVNVGVMGGRSSSQASIVRLDSGDSAETGLRVMRFAGNLSLKNDGPFVRLIDPQHEVDISPGSVRGNPV